MTEGRLRVLFLCTGNPARSQMAEALLRSISHAHIEVASAGSDPRPEIDPAARDVMERVYHLHLAGQEPKHWERFAGEAVGYVIAPAPAPRRRAPSSRASPTASSGASTTRLPPRARSVPLEPGVPCRVRSRGSWAS